ncbi:MAG: M91 family zinc metallopeptidase [Acidobacteriota bacterium]|nr:M91 family zinc metallopeptidase [Acidobacteriota bacterium]
MNDIAKSLVGVALLVLSSVLAFGQGNDNPTGPAGRFMSAVTTGGWYDPYTANASRSVTDIVVAGGVGAYPLALTRTSNSRQYAYSNFGSNTGLAVAGGWQHSYSWQLTNDGDLSNYPLTLAFPDGRQIGFTYSAPDPYYRGLAGVKERFQPFNGSNLGYLIFADGGKIEFLRTKKHYRDVDTGQTVYYYTYVAQAIIDPYGQRTALTYNSDGTVKKVTEPGGRYLQFTYTTISGSTVISQIAGSDGRAVLYSYVTVSFATGSSYLVLDHVSYFGDSSLVAHYTYCAPNTGYAGALPLLKTAIDPMYTGPMWRIGYVYRTTNNPDGTLASYGQISSENYYDGTSIGAAVSTLTVNGSTRVNQRGDGPSQTLTYTGYNLTSATDFNGVAETYGYDGAGYLTSVTDRNGHTTDLTNNTLSGVLLQMQFPLTSSDTPTGTPRGTVFTTYGSVSCADANNRDPNNPYYPCSTIDEGGNSTAITRDTSKRVTRIDYADGGYETFSYNTFGETLTHQLLAGGTESFTYDATGNKQTYRNPSNATGNPTARYSYDSMNRRQIVTDALGSTTGDINHSVGYTYSARGQLTITTLPVDPVDSTQHTIQNTYSTNGDGTLLSVTDQLSHVISYTYDDYRRPLTKTTPQRATGDGTPRTTYSYYDATGTGNDYTHTDSNITHITSPGGMKATTFYDANYRKLSATLGVGTPDAATTSLGYDNVGNVTSTRSPNQQPSGPSAMIGYDERNRMMSAADALTNTTMFAYDAAGRKKTVTRANGQIISFDSYDQRNRLLQQTVKQTPDPDAVTKYTYYASGLLNTMQDPYLVAINSTDSYQYNYDTMGRKTQLTYPLDSYSVHRTEKWHYDTNGRTDTFTNRASSIQTTLYDALNRPTNVSWNDGGVTPTVTLGYDVAARLTSINNANAAITRAYLNDNLWASETTTYADSTARTVSYTYNADALPASVSYPANTYVFSYNYTNRDQLITVINNAGGGTIMTYGYDTDGNLLTRTPDNATSSTYTYDTLDRAATISHALNGTTRTFGYAYDSVSNRLWAKRDGATGDVFGYDVNDQANAVLLNVANPDTTSVGIPTITYDANGNRVTFAAYGATDNYVTNNLNQYSSRNSTTAVYDLKGNTTTGVDGSNYTYDAQNRLLSASKGSNTETFTYDGINRQVTRKIGSATSVYNVYSGWDLIGEYNGGSSTPITAYVYGASGVIKLITASSSYYYYQDASGCTSHLADGAGNLAEWYRYDLHGTPLFYNPSNTSIPGSIYGVRHLFTGQQWYGDIGLYDLRNRVYSPDSGRFLQPDPLGHTAGDTNIYRYCWNNPLKGSDPQGTSIFFGNSSNSAAINAALSYLMNSATFSTIYTALYNSANNYVITTNYSATNGGFSNYLAGGGGQIEWNPNGWGLVDTGEVQSPSIVLAHELAGHAYDYNSDPTQYDEDSRDTNVPANDTNMEEVNAVRAESQIVNELGEGIRYDHLGVLVTFLPGFQPISCDWSNYQSTGQVSYAWVGPTVTGSNIPTSGTGTTGTGGPFDPGSSNFNISAWYASYGVDLIIPGSFNGTGGGAPTGYIAAMIHNAQR